MASKYKGVHCIIFFSVLFFTHSYSKVPSSYPLPHLSIETQNLGEMASGHAASFASKEGA